MRWKNLLSTGNDFLSVRLDKDDLTLFIGKNGHGKSLLLDALCFVLYNRPFRDINKPQLVNSINKKELLVEIAFTAGASMYVVRRGIKPNIFEIYKDKVLIPQDAEVGDYQKHLEEQILCCSYKTFTQVNIVGKASYKPFMDLKPAERRSVVEDLLDSQVYSVMLSLAKTELKEKSEQYRDLATKMEIAKANISAQEMLIERRAADVSLQIKEFERYIEKLDELSLQNRNRFQELNDNLKVEVEALDKITKTPEKVLDMKTNLSVDLRSAEYEKAKIATEIAKVDIESCPVCKQKMDENHKKSMVSEATTKIAELDEKITLYKSRLEKVTELYNMYQAQKEKCVELESKIKELKQRERNNDEQRENYRKQSLALQNRQEEAVDESELSRLRNELRVHSSNYDNLKIEIDLVKRSISHLGDDGIKAKIVSKYIPIINQTINNYLEKMDLFVQFELDEQFNETIKSRFRDTFSYNSFSEGEKLRIDLALILAWRAISKIRNSVSTNIVIYDETLDGSFDSDGVRDFFSVIKDTSGTTSNAIVISHRSEALDGFDSVIKAVKVGNFTEYSRL